jgi:arylsulfatase A-like enzyme
MVITRLAAIATRTFSFLFLLSSNFSLSAQDQRPNIIYIMADDMGFADLSCYGRKDYRTPHLDKLATESKKFTNAYAAAPVCTPTRVAFMTGRYPSKIPLGLKEPMVWSAGDSATGLFPHYPSVATRLQKAGYQTYLVGKWHLGFQPPYSPNQNGFQYFFGFKGGAVDYISHRAPGKGSLDLYENEKPLEIEGYMTDLLGQKAVEIIQTAHSRPFFLAVMFSAPHWPWQAPGDKSYPDTTAWPSGGSAATYAAMMKSLDDAVGAIVAAIDKSKQGKNTVVIFTSDNGGERFSDMGIYKGKKMQLWEGGIRVPAFVRWPAKVKAGTTDQVAVTMDWTATLLSLARATVGTKDSLDGIDLTPLLTGQQKEKERTLFWRLSQRIQQKAVRSGNWKYLRDEKGVEYLFNLATDRTESVNLKAKEPATFSRLQELFRSWEKSVLKPLPLE